MYSTMKQGGQIKKTATKRQLAILFLVMIAVFLLMAGKTNAAAPLAGTVIGNQASATYTDASLTQRAATSNTVQTIVQQVASITLTASQTKIVSPGGTVYYPHTLTNTGNGTDTFSLSAADAGTGNIAFSSLVMYADADGNGVPDSSTAITSTGTLASGAVFKFVVASVIPSTAAGGDAETITVTGTSVYSGAVTASNTDTVNVSGQAVINVTKALSVSSGPSPSSALVTVTLTYTNTGNRTASNLKITDLIGSGSTQGMIYNATSGRWSVTGSGTTLTDASSSDSQGTSPSIIYDWGVTTSNTVTAIINSVAPATTGTLTFKVDINSGLAPGTAYTTNKAAFQYDDGTGTTKGPFDTNSATYLVVQSGGVVANGSDTLSTNGSSEPVTVASANQGAIVSFNNYIWNTGNGTDSFDISLSGSTFPAGTTFQLYKSDGVTPLTDTNGNGVSDTGPVAKSAYYKVVLKATLPANASGGPFSVTKTAKSFFDSSQSDTVIDTLTAVTASTVDVTNDKARGGADCDEAADACGYGSGPETNPVTTKTLNPGSSATFTLYVNNTSSVADSYDLLADDDGTFAANQVLNDLPSGWSTVFKLDGGSGNCSTTGTTITNSGVINAGANKTVCATVTVPSGYAAGDQIVYFRAKSSTTGAYDIKKDKITVNTIRSIAISPDNSGQIYPGGSIVYTHTITNAGNVLEADNSVSKMTFALSDSLSSSGWTSILYYDLNSNGSLDQGDPVIPAAGLHATSGAAALADGLSAGESARLFVKVFSPAGAAIGDINRTSVTATTANLSYTTTVPAAVSSQNTTQVIAGQVRLVKKQAIDAGCDGTPDTIYSSAQITTGALPGVCVRYEITATNDGTANVTSLIVSDATPSNTTYDNGSRNSAGGTCGTGSVDADAATLKGSITAKPSCGSSGTVTADVGTLTPGESVTITFGVMIDN